MKENKLTPEEIKKALECCGEIDDGCLHCPLYGSPAPECGMRLCRESLELHKSQQAEIERLQNDLVISRKETKRYATRRAEAIREFAERLKSEMYTVGFDIDNLVKEVVGDDK